MLDSDPVPKCLLKGRILFFLEGRIRVVFRGLDPVFS